MVNVIQRRGMPLPADRDPGEQPIGAIWSLYGRPSDLLLVDRFARRLGITVSWRPNIADRRGGQRDSARVTNNTE